jgi:hypothetical protein
MSTPISADAEYETDPVITKEQILRADIKGLKILLMDNVNCGDTFLCLWCVDCYLCDHCCGCINCERCTHLGNCVSCYDCHECSLCYKCKGCTSCYRSQNLTNQSFVFCNVQLTEAEYIAAVAKAEAIIQP